MKTSNGKNHEQSAGASTNPFAPDIRSYRLIPYTGKLKKIVGDIKLPFTNISIKSDSKRKEIHLIVSYDEVQKCVYIYEPHYEKYKLQVDGYFSKKSGSSISKNKTNDLSNSSFQNTEAIIDNAEVHEKSSEHDFNNKVNGTDDFAEMMGESLRDCLLSDFGDHKYKRKSIVEIFFLDDVYFKTLLKSGQIKKEAIKFFEKEGDLIKEAESIPTDGFRRLRFEEIVSAYLRKVAVDTTAKTDTQGKSEKLTQSDFDQKKENIPKIEQNPVSSTEKKVQIPVHKTLKPVAVHLHCVRDNSVLTLIDRKIVKIGKNRSEPVIFPRYYCPECRRLYTSIPKYSDSIKIGFQSKRYTNIHPADDRDRYALFLKNPHPLEADSKCYIFAVNKVRPVQCRNCGNKDLLIRGVSRKKGNSYKALYCPVCSTYYLQFKDYNTEKQNWTLLNLAEYPAVKMEYDRERAEKAARKAEQSAQKKLLKEQKKEEKRQRQLEQKRLRAELEEKQRLAKARREKELQNESHTQNLPINFPKGTEQRKPGDNRIRVKDFVVRRTTFKCMHEGHALQNIDGIVEIINDKGNIIQTRVPAGYCPNCNVFFIMESTYQRLKMKGTPICRISDEKTYMKGNIYANGMRLAQESVLMQYGYSVSQQEGLSANRRSKILAILIDNDILTRTEIISYLDFFINQRKNNPKYEKAIEKWEMDREFVSEYKVGVYTQYGISGISRKY